MSHKHERLFSLDLLFDTRNFACVTQGTRCLLTSVSDLNVHFIFASKYALLFLILREGGMIWLLIVIELIVSVLSFYGEMMMMIMKSVLLSLNLRS